MHPIAPGKARRSAFPANPFRRGALIVALTAALTAAGCDTRRNRLPPQPLAP